MGVPYLIVLVVHEIFISHGGQNALKILAHDVIWEHAMATGRKKISHFLCLLLCKY